MKGINMTSYAIHIAHDRSPINPLEEFDCHPPAVIVPDRHAHRVVEYGLTLAPPDLPPAALQAHARHMLSAIDCTSVEEFAECEYLDPGLSEEDVLSALYDGYSEHIAGLPTADRLQALAELHNLAGQPAQTFSGTALIVATAEWQRITGVTQAVARDALKIAHDEYMAWAEGECYGWGIAPIDPDTRYDGTTHEGTPYLYAEQLPGEAEPFDQCWGYYGTDHDASGLFGSAEDAIAFQTLQDTNEAAEAAHWAARGGITA